MATRAEMERVGLSMSTFGPKTSSPTPKWQRLLEAAKKGGHGLRDHVLLLMVEQARARGSEAASLRLDQLNLKEARIWVKRAKGSQDGAQPISGDELRPSSATSPSARAASLAVRNGARRAVHPPGDRLHRSPGGRAGEARARLAAYAAPLLRLPPCEPRPGAGPAADPGLPRAQEHQEHGALHAHQCPAVRRAVGLAHTDSPAAVQGGRSTGLSNQWVHSLLAKANSRPSRRSVMACYS